MWVALAGSRVVGFPRVPPLGARRARRSRAARGAGGGHRHRSRLRGPRHLHPAHARGARRAARAKAWTSCSTRRTRAASPATCKMGWPEVGRLPPRSGPPAGGSPRWSATARRPADRGYTSQTSVGVPAAGRPRPIAAPSTGCSSRPPLRSGWRPAAPAPIPPVALRQSRPRVPRARPRPPADPDGLLVFRLRRRGAAVEGVVDDLVVPRGTPEVARALVDRLARAREADYLIRLQEPRVTRDRFRSSSSGGPDTRGSVPHRHPCARPSRVGAEHGRRRTALTQGRGRGRGSRGGARRDGQRPR